MRRIIFYFAVRGLLLRFIINRSSPLMRHSVMMIFMIGVKSRMVSPKRLNSIIYRAFKTKSGQILWNEINTLDDNGIKIIMDSIDTINLHPEIVEPLYKLSIARIGGE